MSQPNLDNAIIALALLNAARNMSNEEAAKIGITHEEIQKLAIQFIDPQTDATLAQVARNTLRTYLIGKKAGLEARAVVNGAQAPAGVA
jgi:hypothetical protein